MDKKIKENFIKNEIMHYLIMIETTCNVFCKPKDMTSRFCSTYAPAPIFLDKSPWCKGQGHLTKLAKLVKNQPKKYKILS